MTHHDPTNRSRRIAMAATVAACAWPWFATASTYPEKAITLVVPFPPGGATDIIGRVIASELSATLGKQVVVDNRGGAGGSIGAQLVAKAPADGYTLLMGALTSHATIATLEKGKLRYDLVKDLSAVAIVGSVPLVFVANPSFPVTSMQELVAYIQAHPDKVSFGSSGAGAPQRMASEMLKTQHKLDTVHVPYRGSGPAITDLMGGQLQFMAETVPAVLPFINSGKLKALAVASAHRNPNLPDTPTTTEAGFPALQVSSTFGILVPAGTPKAVAQRLNTEIYRALQAPNVQAQLAKQGVIAQTPMSPEEAQERLKAEVAHWAQVIADAKIQPDE